MGQRGKPADGVQAERAHDQPAQLDRIRGAAGRPDAGAGQYRQNEDNGESELERYCQRNGHLAPMMGANQP